MSLATRYIGALTFVLLIGMVLVRIVMLRRRGIQATRFGDLDRTDFLIPPFAVLYIYLVFAAAFGLPAPARRPLLDSAFLGWAGVAFCLSGIALMWWALVSFGRSFRVGIDVERPDRLVTTGAFALSRNPIYVAFGLVLLGELLILPDPIALLYLLGGMWLFNRQVLREEAFLASHYGDEYARYRAQVRRYL
jgi:protein-S-isoprenylcysteine O-methyltransferase Ste14